MTGQRTRGKYSDALIIHTSIRNERGLCHKNGIIGGPTVEHKNNQCWAKRRRKRKLNISLSYIVSDFEIFFFVVVQQQQNTQNPILHGSMSLCVECHSKFSKKILMKSERNNVSFLCFFLFVFFLFFCVCVCVLFRGDVTFSRALTQSVSLIPTNLYNCAFHLAPVCVFTNQFPRVLLLLLLSLRGPDFVECL